jgi:hypothetical protein
LIKFINEAGNCSLMRHSFSWSWPSISFSSWNHFFQNFTSKLENLGQTAWRDL